MATSKVETLPPDAHRLPLDVRPVHYDLTVRTDLEKLQFDGSISIQCVIYLFIPFIFT